MAGGMRNDGVATIKCLQFTSACPISVLIQYETLFVVWYVRVKEYCEPELVCTRTGLAPILDIEHKLLAARIVHPTINRPRICTSTTVARTVQG